MSKQTYDGNSISILEGLEAVRKRPGMYIGSVSTKGLNHLIYEIVDNSVDEYLAGYCNEISVSLEPDGVAVISDNGRGIPVEINDKTGLPAVQVVFTVLHAGGKFENENYKISGGLHGVGASVGHGLHGFFHRIQIHAVVFQGEGHVLAHSQADELSVGILKNRSHHFGNLKDIQILCLPAHDFQAALQLSLIGKRDQSVQTVSERTFSASAGTHKENFLPLVDRQIDVVQRGLGLAEILKAEIFKFYDWCFILLTHFSSPVRRYLILVNQARRFPYRNPPVCAGPDIISPREASLIDGHRHAVEAVHIDKRLAHVDVGKALGVNQNILIERPRLIFNADLDPSAVLHAQLQEHLPGNIRPQASEPYVQHVDGAADLLAVIHGLHNREFDDAVRVYLRSHLFEGNDAGGKPGACVGVDVSSVEGVALSRIRQAVHSLVNHPRGVDADDAFHMGQGAVIRRDDILS